MQAMWICECSAIGEDPVVEAEGEDARLEDAGSGLIDETLASLNCIKILLKAHDDTNGNETQFQHLVCHT
jgi:hypothetical protein